MVNENLIHVKMDSIEAMNSKKDILSLELSFLNIMKNMEEYKKHRKKELEQKIKLLRLIKKFNANLNKLRKIMPKVNYIDRHNPEERLEEIKITGNKKDDIEKQLEIIQNRLKALQGKF